MDRNFENRLNTFRKPSAKGNHPIKNTLLEFDILATSHIEALNLLINYCEFSCNKTYLKEKYGKVQESQNV